MTTFRDKIVLKAMSQLGVPYSWGGGNLAGPTVGIGSGAGTIGFDCGNLARFAFYQGTEGMTPRRILAQGTQAQQKQGVHLGSHYDQLNRAHPGDVIFFMGGGAIPYDPTSPEFAGHCGVFIGDWTDTWGTRGPAIVHAPYPGTVVRIERIDPRWLTVCSIQQYVPYPGA